MVRLAKGDSINAHTTVASTWLGNQHRGAIHWGDVGKQFSNRGFVEDSLWLSGQTTF